MESLLFLPLVRLRALWAPLVARIGTDIFSPLADFFRFLFPLSTVYSGMV